MLNPFGFWLCIPPAVDAWKICYHIRTLWEDEILMAPFQTVGLMPLSAVVAGRPSAGI